MLVKVFVLFMYEEGDQKYAEVKENGLVKFFMYKKIIYIIVLPEAVYFKKSFESKKLWK